jgi:hypothetical protein
VLRERAQVDDLRAREAGGDAQLVGIVGQDLLRRRRPSKRSISLRQIARAASTDSCCPAIVRTSAP